MAKADGNLNEKQAECKDLFLVWVKYIGIKDALFVLRTARDYEPFKGCGLSVKDFMTYLKMNSH